MCLGLERHRLEFPRRRERVERVEVLARRLEELARLLELDPSLDRYPSRVLVLAGDIDVLAAPASDHDLPGIARRSGLVDDDGSSRPLGARLLVLVGPAAVVGHRDTAEHRAVG